MKRGKPNLWTLLTDGLLLFLTLASTAFGVVTAYRMEVLSSVLWAGCALLTPAALFLVHPPKYKLWPLLCAFVLWGWGLWRLWEPLVWGGTKLQCDVVNTIADKIPSVNRIFPVAELPPETWIRTETLWLLMVGCIYALVLAFLLSGIRRALPTILWMLLPILPAICVTEAPDSVPMMGMLSVWLTLILTSLTGSRDPNGTARLRPVVLLCVLAVLQGLCQYLPTQGTAQPLWAADLRDAVINEASRGDLSALLSRWYGWAGMGSTEYMNLLGNAPAHTGRVALRIETNRGGKHYLRGWSADVYTGKRWEPLDRAARRELETIREEGTEPLLLLGEHQREMGTVGRETMTVENVAAPGGCVYYPYVLAALPENAQFGDGSHLERTGPVWKHTVSFYPQLITDINLLYYDRYGRTVYARDGRGEEEDPYRDFVYANDLQVPGELRPILEKWLNETLHSPVGEELWGRTVSDTLSILSLEDFARYILADQGYAERLWEQWVADRETWIWGEAESSAFWQSYYLEGPSREDMDRVDLTGVDLEYYRRSYLSSTIDLVRMGLARTTHYDRDTPAPPANRDYVDWFLNESKQGYCMHYATAATLLLRTAGIPARYVSGYVAYAPYRLARTEVTDHAAHAWVEVYVDDVGWFPLEFTPGFQNGAMGDIPTLEEEPAQTTAPTATAAPSATPTHSRTPEEDEEEDETPDPTPTPSQEPEEQQGPGGGQGGETPSWIWYSIGALLLAAGAALLRKCLLDRRRKKLRGEDTNAAVLYAYACHRRLKSWGGEEREELTALAEKARFSAHTLTLTERDRAAELFYAEKREVREKLPRWKRIFFHLFWGK